MNVVENSSRAGKSQILAREKEICHCLKVCYRMQVYSDWPSYPQLYIRGDLVSSNSPLDLISWPNFLASIEVAVRYLQTTGEDYVGRLTPWCARHSHRHVIAATAAGGGL